jgi:hypothetical protein
VERTAQSSRAEMIEQQLTIRWLFDNHNTNETTNQCDDPSLMPGSTNVDGQVRGGGDFFVEWRYRNELHIRMNNNNNNK